MDPKQRTFTLVPNNNANAANASLDASGPANGRILTSKQLEKIYRQTKRPKRLSRVEQREQDRREQERIRRELEEERKRELDTARRQRKAQILRGRQQARDEAAKAEKKRLGVPLVECHASQDTLTRFFRGNGGRKRTVEGREKETDGREGGPLGGEEEILAVVEEEEEEEVREEKSRPTDIDGDTTLAVDMTLDADVSAEIEQDQQDQPEDDDIPEDMLDNMPRKTPRLLYSPLAPSPRSAGCFSIPPPSSSVQRPVSRHRHFRTAVAPQPFSRGQVPSQRPRSTTTSSPARAPPAAPVANADAFSDDPFLDDLVLTPSVARQVAEQPSQRGAAIHSPSPPQHQAPSPFSRQGQAAPSSPVLAQTPAASDPALAHTSSPASAEAAAVAISFDDLSFFVDFFSQNKTPTLPTFIMPREQQPRVEFAKPPTPVQRPPSGLCKSSQQRRPSLQHEPQHDTTRPPPPKNPAVSFALDELSFGNDPFQDDDAVARVTAKSPAHQRDQSPPAALPQSTQAFLLDHLDDFFADPSQENLDVFSSSQNKRLRGAHEIQPATPPRRPSSPARPQPRSPTTPRDADPLPFLLTQDLELTIDDLAEITECPGSSATKRAAPPMSYSSSPPPPPPLLKPTAPSQRLSRVVSAPVCHSPSPPQVHESHRLGLVQAPEDDPPPRRFFTASGETAMLSVAMVRSRRAANLEDLSRLDAERREAGVLLAAMTRGHMAAPRGSRGHGRGRGVVQGNHHQPLGNHGALEHPQQQQFTRPPPFQRPPSSSQRLRSSQRTRSSQRLRSSQTRHPQQHSSSPQSQQWRPVNQEPPPPDSQETDYGDFGLDEDDYQALGAVAPPTRTTATTSTTTTTCTTTAATTLSDGLALGCSGKNQPSQPRLPQSQQRPVFLARPPAQQPPPPPPHPPQPIAMSLDELDFEDDWDF